MPKQRSAIRMVEGELLSAWVIGTGANTYVQLRMQMHLRATSNDHIVQNSIKCTIPMNNLLHFVSFCTQIYFFYFKFKLRKKERRRKTTFDN